MTRRHTFLNAPTKIKLVIILPLSRGYPDMWVLIKIRVAVSNKLLKSIRSIGSQDRIFY